MAGAFAAVTAAALGAQLGVAGTIIGAGVGSLISAIASALFKTSLEGSRSSLQVVVDRARRTPSGSVFASPTAIETAVEPAQPDAAKATTDGFAVRQEADVAYGTGTATSPAESRRTSTSRPAGGWTTMLHAKWRYALAGALATFVVAFGAITGYELITGHTLSGDPGSTTIARVIERPAATTPTQSPTTPSAPAETTTAPATPSQDPAQQSEAPATPTTEPTQPSDSSAPATPSEPASPTSGAGSGSGSGTGTGSGTGGSADGGTTSGTGSGTGTGTGGSDSGGAAQQSAVEAAG